jgi:hypothetical protein
MAELLPPDQPRTKRRVALVSHSAFSRQSVDPAGYPMFCVQNGDVVEVAISPAAHDYLEGLGESERDSELIGALPFGQANAPSRRKDGPSRLWATNFALLHGARTEAAVEDWIVRHGVRTRSSTVGTLYLLDEQPPPEIEGDWWDYARSSLTFHLPGGPYRSGAASAFLFRQLLEELDEDLVREIVLEGIAWAPEALRRFSDRSRPVHRATEVVLPVEALLRAVGASWREVDSLGLAYRPPHAQADLSVYLNAIRGT